MKKLLISVTVLLSFSAQADFLHPLQFDGSEMHQNRVVTYIQERVRKDYCDTIDLCQEVMLRMMEQENLGAFKRLTNATHTDILDRAIADYCGAIDMCTYQMIEIMYNENVSASQQQLTW
ncbi:hypothetical protein LRP52_41420 [Photobacterium sp. ZSDE20]|uniref:DUF3718 domain-containing protein n=1 Tax=Photobacterium pectinilyticum TaxID=2906793 RepID=A0ABT1N7V3_9GAMM|nr:hypothetical protein [Photobacterium sp. ZSDE20]MCQ1060844.1 hypothetical protein [Photobacterium sp. ZSDE20]MDD1828643.1 hypothetical protein [Photobacterium sp. ZSDE20]